MPTRNRLVSRCNAWSSFTRNTLPIHHTSETLHFVVSTFSDHRRKLSQGKHFSCDGKEKASVHQCMQTLSPALFSVQTEHMIHRCVTNVSVCMLM